MKSEMPMVNPLPGNGRTFSHASQPRGTKLSGVSDSTSDQSVPEEEASSSMTEKAPGQAFGPKFKKVLDAVTKANKKANVKDDDANDASASGATAGSTIDPKALNAELAAMGIGSLHVPIGSNAGDQTDGASQNSQAQLQQASQIIQDAILRISQALNMKINSGLENLQLGNPSQNVINQFAEIVNALKGITSLLDEAVKNNMPVEISGKVFDQSQAGQAEQILGTETFKIQMALEMAGLSGEVAATAAQKNNSASASGIVTALDPALLSMPASQANQVLGKALQAQEKDVETLFAGLAEKLNNNAGADDEQIKNKIAAIAAGVGLKNVQATTSAGGPSTAGKPSDDNSLDPKVMRTLLKIDPLGTGNLTAAEKGGKIGPSNTMKVLLAKDLGAPAPAIDDASKTVASGVDLTKDPADPLAGIADLHAPAAPKTIEESVMDQLTDKVQSALKTGVTEIRLLLRPESLGEMRVKLTVDGDVVMGKIYVENQQVKHIVEANMQSLKDSLAQHNLQAGAFDVNVGGGSREDMRETARSMAQNTTSKVGALSENTEPDKSSASASGLETGRRFGTNTVEYFV
jgi:flagellar hook-length control protein FliK